MCRKFLKCDLLYWLIPFLICLPWMMHLNNDNYYMIATGEEIIKNGIPYINPFAAQGHLSIVVQNWVYCVLNYAVYKCFGTLKALYIISVLQFLIFDIVVYKIVRDKCDRHDSGLFVLLSNIIFAYYMGCARPAILTFTLLIIEVKLFCDWCENGTLKTWQNLLFLFPITIFIANVQSSNLFFILCPFFAFLAAKVWAGEWDRRLAVALFILLPITIICMLLNPYGIDGALYLFNSIGHVHASELEGIDALSIPGIFFIVSCALVVKYIQSQLNRIRTLKDNKLSLTYKHFTVFGFFLLSMTCKRNQLFLVPAFLIVWYEVNHCHLGLSYKYHCFADSVIWKTFLGLLIALISVAFLSIYAVRLVEAFGVGRICGIETHFDEERGTEKFYEYLEENNLKVQDASVFPGSSYLEMKGMKVFIDPRNEIYDKPINKKGNYYMLCYDLFENGTKADFDKFFSDFQFDYYIASHDEGKLLNYLDNSDEFTKIFEDTDFYAYERNTPKRYVYDYTQYSTGDIHRLEEAADDYIDITFLKDDKIRVNVILEDERKDYVFQKSKNDAGFYFAKVQYYGWMHEVGVAICDDELAFFVDESDCESFYRLQDTGGN